MYGLYTQLNEYDQPEYVAMVFDHEPDTEELLALLSSAYSHVTEEKVNALLSGKTIYNTVSGVAESWCYNTFKLCKIEPKTWL